MRDVDLEEVSREDISLGYYSYFLVPLHQFNSLALNELFLPNHVGEDNR